MIQLTYYPVFLSAVCTVQNYPWSCLQIVSVLQILQVVSVLPSTPILPTSRVGTSNPKSRVGTLNKFLVIKAFLK